MMTITTSINSARTTGENIRKLPTSARLSDGNGMLDAQVVQTLRLDSLSTRDLSAKIIKAERDSAIARIDVYRKWFFQEVMQVDKHASIVVIPIENISPRYRDDATYIRFHSVGVSVSS